MDAHVRTDSQESKGKHKVVIVGAGFGGINAAKSLRKADVRILMVDRRNYHLFQPLLYQVATAGVAPSDIAYPVRAIFRGQKNFDFLMAEVTGVDLEQHVLHTSLGPVDFDYLILSIGGQTNFFGLDSVKENGLELKDIQSAERIRNHILMMFEKARHEQRQEICRALRTFVIVGGGPTGVECSGSISELIRLVLVKDFPDLDVGEVRVILLEMTDQLLPGFPTVLSEKAVETLERKRVEVLLNETVTGYDGDTITLKSGETIRSYTLIWAAGIRAEQLVDSIDVRKGKQERVIVEDSLQIPGHPEVFVIGDAAYVEHEGKPLPMVAPVAIQQAKTAAKNINNLLEGRPLEKFVYRDPGSLATIGRSAAVARVGRFNFSGFIAWIVWLVVHLFWLIGFRNRLFVLIDWAWDYLLYERAVRLITSHPKLNEQILDLVDREEKNG
jgi:NADH:ubiquinone reductase (H+-translocating)